MSTPVASAPAPHTANSSSHQNAKVVAAAGHRHKTAGGLHLPASQSVSLPGGLRHDLLLTPASSVPNFSSFGVIDIKEKNILIHNVLIQFVTSAVAGSGLTGSFVPAAFWIQRLEICQGGVTVDTLLGNQIHLMNQILEFDEDRVSINQSMGLYSSLAQRTAMSSQSTTNTFHVNLKTYFDQGKGHAILTNGQEIQLRVYMANLADVFYVSAGTLTSCTIQSCTAICEVTRLDAATAATRLQAMTVHPEHNIFHENKYMTYSVPIGTTSINIILGAITGNLAGLMFTLRSSLVGLGLWNYTLLQNFTILDAGGASLTGGQPVSGQYCANVMNSKNIKSSYNAETSFGVTNNGANFYIFSHSADLVDSISAGRALSSRKYSGNEVLQLTFPTATVAIQTLDLYGFGESILEVSPSSVKKLSL